MNEDNVSISSTIVEELVTSRASDNVEANKDEEAKPHTQRIQVQRARKSNENAS